MRLCKLPEDQWAAAVCCLAGPMDALAQDPACARAARELLDAGLSRMTPEAAWARIAACVLPLAQAHEREVWAMIGVLTGRSAAEAKRLDAAQTLAELRASADGDVLRLFLLCRRYGAEAVLEAVSGMRCGGMEALNARLAQREQRQARAAYIAQLLWHIGAGLYAMNGAVWQLPDWFAVFPEREAPDGRTGEEVVRQVLRRMKGGTEDGGAV